jgi:AcrR family transcriptional regulator
MRQTADEGAPGGGRTYAGRSAEERRAGRRAAFLAAGLELFGTRPYSEVTISDLVAEAGLNRRAFYECFTDRESLLRAVHDQVIEGNVTVLGSVEPGAVTAEQAERMVVEFVGYMAADVRRARIQWQAVVGVSAAMEEHRRVTSRALAEQLAGLLGDTAGATPQARRRAAFAYVGGIGALFTDWLWEPDFTLDELRDELVIAMRRRFFPDRLASGG